jgi:hypothetical protein
MPGLVAARARALAEHRGGLGRSLTARFWLRFHGSLIVAGAFASGFLANAAMLQWPVHGAIVRWPIAVLVGYAAFFVLVRLWLAYVGAKPVLDGDPGDGGLADAIDLGALPRVGPRTGGGGPWSGGGGSSGGGGASASWGDAQAPSRSGLSLGLGDLDGDGLLPVVLGLVALALLVALLGGAIHLVWIAPEMLIDAAFAALLASGAVPGMRRMSEPDWSVAVLRRTWPVLAVVMAVALGAAWAFMHWFPGLRTLGEAWRMLT